MSKKPYVLQYWIMEKSTGDFLHSLDNYFTSNIKEIRTWPSYSKVMADFNELFAEEERSKYKVVCVTMDEA